MATPVVVHLLPFLLAGGGLTSDAAASAPEGQPCYRTCLCKGTEVTCSGRRLGAFLGWPPNAPIVTLDMSYNSITMVNEDSLKGLIYLENLYLDGNQIQAFHPAAFRDVFLKRLSLKNADLHSLPDVGAVILKTLEILHLESNKLTSLDPGFFHSTPTLKHLFLSDNWLSEDALPAFRSLKNLRTLHLGNNSFLLLPPLAFEGMDDLRILILERNRIQEVDERALQNLKILKILILSKNHLDRFPRAVSSLVSLEEISLAHNHIASLPDDAFRNNPDLASVELKGNPILTVGHRAFVGLPDLRKLILSDVGDLRLFPNLTGSSSLEIIRLDRSKLKSVPSSLCEMAPLLKSLDLRSNLLESLPRLSGCRKLKLLDLSYNKISCLEAGQLGDLTLLHDLLLEGNSIRTVPANAFQGLKSLQILDLSDNGIESIHPEAFSSLENLEKLNLAKNGFPVMPVKGLGGLLHLKCYSNPNLRQFPPIASFPRLRSVVLSYAYHCCPFRGWKPSVPTEGNFATLLQETVLYPRHEDVNLSWWASEGFDAWDDLSNFSAHFDVFLPHPFEDFGEADEITHHGFLNNLSRSEDVIQCMPMPGPFMPCEDLFDWWSLRCGVWMVFLLSLLGNSCVVFVMLFTYSKMDVPRFLVCNLALADLFMGIYLGFLAVVDVSTLGHFQIHAIRWQMSVACQLAGFFGVFSCELSVFTLAVITLERNYAITNAMNLNKRLSLRHAAYVMSAGWSFSFVVALLPLFGVSDYRKYAVCLPFETSGTASLLYVLALMTLNGVSFLTLIGCYLRMYLSIKGSQAWNSNDSRIAKRMALLVVTDFVCWFPVAFFTVTAVFGVELVSLEEAKVFTVFVLPLNSCCNPFLYAILTKQFKKDCVHICKVVEESRVTRGIGRCKNDSNFSNRGTGSNSVLRSSSREQQHHHHHHHQDQRRRQPCSCRKERDFRWWSWSSLRNAIFRTDRSLLRWTAGTKGSRRDAIRSDQEKKQRTSLSSDHFSSTPSDSARSHRQASRSFFGHSHYRRSRTDSQDSTSRVESGTTTSSSLWRTSRSSVSSESERRGSEERPLPPPVASAAPSFAFAIAVASAKHHSSWKARLPRQESSLHKPGETPDSLSYRYCGTGEMLECKPLRRLSIISDHSSHDEISAAPHGPAETAAPRAPEDKARDERTALLRPSRSHCEGTLGART